MSPSAREQHSAGLVLFREPGDSPSNPAARQFLLLDYGRHWDFAKGHLEPGEDHCTAAIRELREETGITDADILPGFERQITYYFRGHKRGLVRKTVTYFLGRTCAEKILLSDEHVGGEFLPLEKAIKRLTFASSRQVLQEAGAFLETAAPPATDRYPGLFTAGDAG